MATRPDILLLVVDTQRRDRLSSYGYARETSPNIDAIAADAMLFRRAISAAQWTIPSHASMFTGRYPSEHHTYQTAVSLPQTLPTLAERLRDSGYHTVAFCNNPLVGAVNNGLRRGFQSFLNYSGLLTSRPNQAGSEHNTFFDQYRQWFKHRLSDGLNFAQDIFARSDTLFAFSLTPMMVPLWQTALSFKGNTTKSLRDAAQFLVGRQGLPDDQPIFCFINLMGVHMPYHPATRHMDRFAPAIRHSHAAQRFLRHFNTDVFGWFAPSMAGLDEERQDLISSAYDAEVATQDEAIGEFFDQLRIHRRLDEIFLIVCSDHGEMLGERQFVGHSTAVAYNEITRVPLLIRDPAGDLERGGTNDRVVSTRRIFHTVLTAAGLASDAEAQLTLANASQPDPEHDLCFSEAFPVHNVVRLIEQRGKREQLAPFLVDQPRRVVWDRNYKLILTGDQRTELYDVQEDPREQVDLSAIVPEEVERLRAALAAFQAHNGQGAESTPGGSAGNPLSAIPVGAPVELEDPQVRRRLHDLGYLE